MNENVPVTARTLRVGEPDIAGPLAVFPVFGPAPRHEYRSFAEAAALGASVRELAPEPSVNDIVIDNPLDMPVLLYEGEEVQGAQQDRTFDVSVLVPAGVRLQVPVSCVEAGRWDGHRHEEAFRPAPQAAFPELRRAKNRAARLGGVDRAEQGEVWQLVKDKAERHGARSDTAAMHDVFEARRGAVDELRTAVRRRDGQLGAVAAIGGQVVVADVVGRADVFAALHAPLVTGYALDAVEHGSFERTGVVERAAVQRFVDAAVGAAKARGPAIGLGQRMRFADGTVEGAWLELDGELIAATAFPGEQLQTRVRRPSRRR